MQIISRVLWALPSLSVNASARVTLVIAAALGVGNPIQGAEGPKFLKTQLDPRFRSEGVAVADFNRDGIPDVAAGNVWYQGPDWRPFPMRSRTVSYDPLQFSDSFINFADDINKDGWPDLITVGLPGSATYWWENPKSSGARWTRHLAVSVTNNESPAYEDLDGDGVKELVFGYAADGNPDSAGRRMALAKPGPDVLQPWTVQTFSANAGPGSGRFTHGLGVGDMNGDGRADVATTSGWYEQPVNFSQPVWRFHPVNLGAEAGQLYIEDFDRNGMVDVLSSSAHNYGVWLHSQSSSGVSTTEIFRGFSQSHSLRAADLNGDGLTDFVTGKRKFAHTPPGDPGTFEPSVLYWFEQTKQNGRPAWTPHLIDDSSGVGTQFELADMNLDGRIDIVTSNKNGVFVFTQVPEALSGGWLFASVLLLRLRLKQKGQRSV